MVAMWGTVFCVTLGGGNYFIQKQDLANDIYSERGFAPKPLGLAGFSFLTQPLLPLKKLAHRAHRMQGYTNISMTKCRGVKIIVSAFPSIGVDHHFG